MTLSKLCGKLKKRKEAIVVGKQTRNEKNRKIVLSIIDSELKKDAYLKARHEQVRDYKCSHESQRDIRIRDVSQFIARSKKEVCKKINEYLECYTDDLINLILKELELTEKLKTNECVNRNISMEEIKNVISISSKALNKLRKVSENKEIALERRNRFFSEYERLFNTLMEYDVRFVYFAPFKSYDRSIVKNKLQYFNENFRKRIEEVQQLKSEQGERFFVEAESGKYENIVEMVEELENVLWKSRFEMVITAEYAVNDLFGIIKSEIELGNKNISQVEKQDIVGILKSCKIPLKNLFDLSYDKEIEKVAGWDCCDPYTELFNNLIKENILFAMFAPKLSLNREGIDYSQMSVENKISMMELFDKYKLWENKTFFENYKEEFADFDNVNSLI